MIYIILSILICIILLGLEIKQKNILFLPLIFVLFIVQLFIIMPGSDISSASYGEFKTYKFMGMSYSTIISIILIVYCLFNTFIRNKLKIEKNDVFLLISIITLDVLGILNGNHAISEKIDIAAKINMPFIIYVYLKYSYIIKNIKKIDKLFIIVNLIFIIQVPICKILTGKFSASTFYTYIMKEEYYGYYSSPHAFAAILGIFSILALKNINNKYLKKVSYFCLICNVVLMFLSGVRTYVLALILSICILFFNSFYSKKLKRMRILALVSIVVVLLGSNFIFERLATTRLNISYNTTELTSGRTYRWQRDIQYFDSEGIMSKVFGKGFKAIYVVNDELINVYINSLNIFIDLLVDNGILGMILIIYIYYKIFKRNYGNKNKYFMYAILLYAFIGSFINNLLPYITVMTAVVILLRILELENLNENETNFIEGADNEKNNIQFVI